MTEQQTDQNQRETFFINADGQKIHCRYWNENTANRNHESETRGLVFISHGLGAHTEWFTEIAELIVDQGFYVFGHDHLGHGQSDGERAHIDDFNHYVRDVFQHIDEVKERFPADTPVFILGHSMGGTIAILSAMQRPSYFKGAILSAPAVIPSPGLASPLKIFFGKILAGIFPQYIIQYLNVENASRDPEMVKRYKNDPLYVGFIKAKWGLSVLTAVQTIQSKLEEIEWTFLVLHGDGDFVTDVSGSQLLYDKAKSKDKMIKIYKGYYHTILLEPPEDRKVVQEDIIDWLLKHC